jgi:hypothetical protein
MAAYSFRWRIRDCCLQLQMEDWGLLPTASDGGLRIAAYSFRWSIRDCCLQLLMEDWGLLPTASERVLSRKSCKYYMYE